MQNYIIMNKDRRVASVRSDGSCTIYSESFMPYNLYLEKTGNGFKNTRGDDQIRAKKAKGAMMVSPSGFRILVLKHLKED